MGETELTVPLDGSSESTIQMPQPWSAASAGPSPLPVATPGPPPIPAATITTPIGVPIMPVTPVQPPQPSRPAVVAAPRRRRWAVPAQLLVLVLVVAASAFFGYTAYRTVAGIGLSASGWSEVSGWSWGLLLGATATLVVAVVAVVALIRTQSSRLVAVVALIVALFLPPIALCAGGRWGFDVAAATISGDLVAFTADGTSGAILDWLMELISQ